MAATKRQKQKKTGASTPPSRSMLHAAPSLHPNSLIQQHYFLIGAAVSFLCLLYHWLSIPPVDFNYEYYYPRIANLPYYGEETPYGYRVLSGLIVRCLPFTIDTGFKLLNLSSLFFSACLLTAVCRQIGVTAGFAWIAPIPYLLSSGVHEQLSQIWLADPLNQLFLTAILYFMLKRRDEYVCIISLFGVLNRETLLLFMPIWYLVAYGFVMNSKALLRTLLVWGPSVLAILLLRFVWYPMTYYPMMNETVNLYEAGFFEYYWLEITSMYPTFSAAFQRLFSFTVANAYLGTLLPFFLLGLFTFSTVYRYLALFIAAGWLQLLLVHSLDRLLVLQFPVMIPLAFLTIESLDYGLNKRISLFIFSVAFILMPNSFLLGILLLGAILLYNYMNRTQPILKPDVQPYNFTLTPWSKKSFSLIVFSFILFLIMFSVFCFKTKRYQAQLVASIPAHPENLDKPDWNYYLMKDQVLSPPVPWRNRDFETARITLKNPPVFNFFMLRLIDKLPFGSFSSLIVRYNRTNGNNLTFAFGAIQNNGFVGKSHLYLTPYNNGFIHSFTEITPESEVMGIGVLPEHPWEGEISFWVFDLSHMMEQRKSKTIYPMGIN